MRLAWVLMTCLVLVALRSISAQTLEEKKIARLIEQLANDSFQAREAASKKLAEIGESALAALDKAKTGDDFEVRIRAQRISKAIIDGIEDKICVEQLRLTGHKPNLKYLVGEYRDGPVTSVSVSADGKRLLTSGFDTTLRLWDTETGKELCVLEGHTAPILGAALSPDATRALSACMDNSVRLWDVTTGKHLQQMSHQFNLTNSITFGPQGQARVAFGPKGQALSGGGDGTMKLWNLDTGGGAGNFTCHSNPRGIAVSVVAYNKQARLAATSGNDQPIRLWDLNTGKVVRTITTAGNVFHTVCFSADGKRLAACADAKPRLFDVETGKELLQIDGAAALSLAFSPDGTRLVTGGDWGDLTVRVWDAKTGKELRKYEGHGGCVGCVAFFPDGQRIASSSYDGTARIWGAPRPEKIVRDTSTSLIEMEDPSP
jgi:WD40 repeat protein